MNVNGVGSMEQQLRKMDGSGGGQGKGGMKDIIQSLSIEDRTSLKEQLSSMTQEDRMAAVSEMKTVDKASMNAQEYTQALLDILNQTNIKDEQTDILSVYA